jgi:hypothetical protein
MAPDDEYYSCRDTETNHRSLITMAVPVPPNIGTELPKLVAVNPLP